MASLTERMAAFVRRNFPHAHCYSCQAKHLEVTEPEVRSATQILLAREPRFQLSRRACRTCGRDGQLLWFRDVPRDEE